MGPRLIEWIIPGILLIANVHFAPIGKKRYLMIPHLLGDPIDTMWRLLTMVEDWTESYRLVHEFIQHQARPNGLVRRYDIQPEMIAVVISAAARLIPSLNMGKFSRKLLKRLDNQDDGVFVLLRKTTTAPRDQRQHDIGRTGLAIVVYLAGVVAGFLPAVGGSSNPSGGKLSPPMMLI
jgi:hypothetical protein